jgi:hypothetical protein
MDPNPMLHLGPLLQSLQRLRGLFLGSLPAKDVAPYARILQPLRALHVEVRVDLSRTGLLAAVGDCTDLRHLGMVGRDSHHAVAAGPYGLPVAFGALTRLTSVVISNTGLSSDGLGPLFELSSIQELELSDNRFITALPIHITRLGSLRSLRLWNSNVRVLPDDTSDLNGLTELCWSNRHRNNPMTEPVAPLHLDNLHQLRSLRSLNILERHPSQLPEHMAWPPALTQLQVVMWDGIRMPGTLSMLVGLERLVVGLYGNAFAPHSNMSLPQGLDALTRLTWLQLYGWRDEQAQQGVPPALLPVLHTHQIDHMLPPRA